MAREEYRRDIGILNHGYVVCRDTEKEALDYLRYYVDEKGDWEAVDGLIAAITGSGERSMPPERIIHMRPRAHCGLGRLPASGHPGAYCGRVDQTTARRPLRHRPALGGLRGWSGHV